MSYEKEKDIGEVTTAHVTPVYDLEHGAHHELVSWLIVNGVDLNISELGLDNRRSKPA